MSSLSTWFSNWIETLPKDLQARLDLWRFCCDCLDNVNGEYARMSFAVQDDYAHTDRAHEFFDADVARDSLELLRKAHSERRAVCRSLEKHALFSANPRERFRVALTCSHGFGSSSLSTLRAAESLVRVLSEHSDRCVCELFYDRDTMYLFLSAANPNSTDPALRSDFLPGALWTYPEVDFDAWVSGFCQDSPSGCFAAFELFFAKVRALPKDDWINRREACDRLFRALDGMESRDCWFFITLRVPLVRDRPPKSSSEMRFRVAVPLLGNHASREFATQNPRPRYYDEFCAICGSKQLYTHDWGIERNAPLQSFASAVRWARFRPTPETASGRTARWRWRAPKGWAFGRPSLELDLGRTVLSGLRMGPNVTVGLPYGARMLAPNELRAKLGGECPYWFLQRVLERLLFDGPS